jgi:hypothetical protein
MQHHDLISFVQYNNWANQRLLVSAAQLDDMQLHTDADLSFGSPFLTLSTTAPCTAASSASSSPAMATRPAISTTWILSRL